MSLKEITIKNVLVEMGNNKRNTSIFIIGVFLSLLLFLIISSFILISEYSYTFGFAYYGKSEDFYTNGDKTSISFSDFYSYLGEEIEDEYFDILLELLNNDQISVTTDTTNKNSHIEKVISIAVSKADYDKLDSSISLKEFLDIIGDNYVNFVYPRIAVLSLKDRSYASKNIPSTNIQHYASTFAELQHLSNLTEYLYGNLNIICTKPAIFVDNSDYTINDFSRVSTDSCGSNVVITLSNIRIQILSNLNTLNSYKSQITYEKNHFDSTQEEYFEYLVNELGTFREGLYLNSFQEDSYSEEYYDLLNSKLNAMVFYDMLTEYEQIDFTLIDEFVLSTSETIYGLVSDLSSYKDLETISISSNKEELASTQILIIFVLGGTLLIPISFYSIKASLKK